MRLGILGAGQLGRMLGLAAHPLGIEPVFLDPAAHPPAGAVGRVIGTSYTDRAGLQSLAERAEIVTYEFENVPAEAAVLLAERVAVRPGVAALETAQDRLLEKRCFERLSIPHAAYAAVSTRKELEAAVEIIGTPAMLKTRRMGYDGKGQAVVRSAADAASAWAGLGEGPCVLEAFVEFERELSLLSVRSVAGDVAFYPLTENVHRDGILRLSIAPADVDPAVERSAREAAARVLEALDYVGVLAIELFDRGGELLANEMAPRVHNSGHWTIEGAATSQFENHVRAVTGLPLGSTEAVGASAMVNLIGSIPSAAAVLAVPDAHLHLYGKSPRPGRKLGHITVRAGSRVRTAEGIQRLRTTIPELAL